MDYKKLHKKIWDLMQSMHSTADQIDGLGEEFPDMAKEIDEFFKRLEKVERLEEKGWDKFHVKQSVYYPEHGLTVEHETVLVDDLDDIELDDIQVEDDGRTIIA